MPHRARGRVAVRRRVETLLDVPPRGPADRQEGPDVSGLTFLLLFFFFRLAPNLNCQFSNRS